MTLPKKARKKYGNPANNRPLAGDMRRLVQPSGNADPRKLGGSMSGPGGARDRAAVLIDPTDAVLLADIEVTIVDHVYQGQSRGEIIFMTLSGRVNKRTDQVQVGYFFDSDGAAAIITELLAIADRQGAELLNDVTRRLVDLQHNNAIDLPFLRAAIDNAIAAAGEVAP